MIIAVRLFTSTRMEVSRHLMELRSPTLTQLTTNNSQLFSPLHLSFTSPQVIQLLFFSSSLSLTIVGRFCQVRRRKFKTKIENLTVAQADQQFMLRRTKWFAMKAGVLCFSVNSLKTFVLTQHKFFV